MDRNEAIKEIRAALKRRTGKTWSVTGGRGTAWGWITITAPPSRLVDGWKLTQEDRAELSAALGVRDVGPQHEMIPASPDYRQAYVDMANGRWPSVTPSPYWD